MGLHAGGEPTGSWTSRSPKWLQSEDPGNTNLCDVNIPGLIFFMMG